MTDYFALLGEPRLPWLETERLKDNFWHLSSTAHPDRVHGASNEEKHSANQRYAELNAAYNCLREPKDRLLHLLELETGTKPRDVQRIPAGTMDLFVEVGQMCRDVDDFLSQKGKTASPLLQAQLFRRGLEWIDKLNALQERIHQKRNELLAELKMMNLSFETAPAAGSSARQNSLPLERLEQVYRVFSYVARWTEQIRERVVQLSS